MFLKLKITEKATSARNRLNTIAIKELENLYLRIML